uniref:Uncharacterized protein n=1 Tax=Meloidogyne incognita TaxID=6306 RepID=A0A914NMN2_MELIC
MSRQGQMLQAIGEDGIVYTWYRRPYNRRVPTQRQLELQQQLQPIQGEPPPTPQMLNPKQTQLSELGELILHTNTINGFNLMLEQFKRLIVFAVGRCANFQSELEKLPRSLRILNLNLFDVVNSANAIGNIRRQAPNIHLKVNLLLTTEMAIGVFEHCPIRCFQSLPINDRFNMEHVSRLFQSASKRSWNIQEHVVVVPDVVLDEEYNYSIDGRYLFRLLMKRCARYCLELTIHSMLKQDRIFRLLHLGYRVEHLCIDSLHSICGSELKEIGERLPNLKSLIIKRSTFHFSTIKCFNLMLEQLEQLQILSISNCNNFKCQLEQLPSSLRIFFLDDFRMENAQNVLRNIRLRAPNV